jgi:glutamate synthase domain-containing protein 3
MVDLEPVVKSHDIDLLQALVENHRRLTGSAPAQYVLENWDTLLPKFVKVMPIDYRRVLEQMEREQALAAQEPQEMAASQP